jgi:hypothetical protein
LAGLDPAHDPPADALVSFTGPPLVRDDFAAERPDLWETRGGTWTYANGKLMQTEIGAKRSALRLKTAQPVNFEARLSYIPIGGETWKSVGISFDVNETNDVLAYLSAYAGGSKAQIAHGAGGNYAYPSEGAKAIPIALNEQHELVLRVRGNLVNVIVDGRSAIAYQLPIPRRPGALELVTFDAAAEFVGFELHELPMGYPLVDAAAKPQANGAMSLEQTKLAFAAAEKALIAAELMPRSIQARAAADRARFQSPAPANLGELIRAAVKAEREAALAQAEADVSRAELELAQSVPEKKAEVEKKLSAAQTARETAGKLANQPGDSYASLVGALKTLENNLETEESRRKPFPATSTGRRAALANWIADRRHPLTARVAVNHIWNRHFGQALVPTVFDFGRKGTPPTHPELLDWLAVEFMEHGWSMKHIHKLIVLSETYRLTSSKRSADPPALARDTDNKFYWRRNPVRMEAQLVRDGLLFLAGELDLKQGGPPIPVSDESSRRRSLYFVHSHNEHQKFLSMFDDASVLECYRRADSIVPQQALALENSPLAGKMAEKIAERIGTSLPDAEFVRQAFLTIICAEPSEPESKAALEAMNQWTAIGQSAGQANPAAQARANLIQALLNHNDFVTIR